MTDFELTQKDELRQRKNVIFRNDIIKRERLKVFRHNLFVQQQNAFFSQTHALQQQKAFARVTQKPAVESVAAKQQPKQQTGQTPAPSLKIIPSHTSQKMTLDSETEVKAARFAHLRHQLMQNLTAWNRATKKDVIFVRSENRKGAFLVTFERDAGKVARILGTKPKQLRLNNRRMNYISVPEKRMAAVISQLDKRDVKAKIINTRGQEVPMTRKKAPSLSLSPKTAAPAVTPKLDVMNSLDKNRQDSRRADIHVESLAVWADSKGNWKVSGMVNGLTITAKSVEQSDAVNYKIGKITKEEMAEKYQLHVPPKQENKVTRKNNMVRRYTLDNN